MTHSDVLIVGGGLAGLACAHRLAQWQIDFQLLEATDRVGGRVRTDRCDGFQLDHGFQVLWTADPVCRQLLDYNALQLRAFDPGAMIRLADRFTWSDRSWRSADQLLATLFAPAGTAAAEPPLAADPPLAAEPSEMHAGRQIAVPAEGMAAIPRQLAAQLPAGCLRTNRSVEYVRAGAVQTSDGEEHRFKQLVIATEAPAANRLLGGGFEAVRWRATTCLHFAADHPPIDRPLLVLAGDGSGGPVAHLAVISNVAPSYAPAGQSLVSVSLTHDGGPVVTIPDPDALQALVRKQLAAWFGRAVETWRLLRTYHIPYALPAAAEAASRVQPLDPQGPIVCGDHRPAGSIQAGSIQAGSIQAGSIQGALHSGLAAAEAIRQRWSRPLI